jgi:hypothetical protein
MLAVIGNVSSSASFLPWAPFSMVSVVIKFDELVLTALQGLDYALVGGFLSSVFLLHH